MRQSSDQYPDFDFDEYLPVCGINLEEGSREITVENLGGKGGKCMNPDGTTIPAPGCNKKFSRTSCDPNDACDPSIDDNGRDVENPEEVRIKDYFRCARLSAANRIHLVSSNWALRWLVAWVACRQTESELSTTIGAEYVTTAHSAWRGLDILIFDGELLLASRFPCASASARLSPRAHLHSRQNGIPPPTLIRHARGRNHPDLMHHPTPTTPPAPLLVACTRYNSRNLFGKTVSMDLVITVADGYEYNPVRNSAGYNSQTGYDGVLYSINVESLTENLVKFKFDLEPQGLSEQEQQQFRGLPPWCIMFFDIDQSGGDAHDEDLVQGRPGTAVRWLDSSRLLPTVASAPLRPRNPRTSNTPLMKPLTRPPSPHALASGPSALPLLSHPTQAPALSPPHHPTRLIDNLGPPDARDHGFEALHCRFAHIRVLSRRQGAND